MTNPKNENELKITTHTITSAIRYKALFNKILKPKLFLLKICFSVNWLMRIKRIPNRIPENIISRCQTLESKYSFKTPACMKSSTPKYEKRVYMYRTMINDNIIISHSLKFNLILYALMTPNELAKLCCNAV